MDERFTSGVKLTLEVDSKFKEVEVKVLVAEESLNRVEPILALPPATTTFRCGKSYTGWNPIKLFTGFLTAVQSSKDCDGIFCYGAYSKSVLYSFFVSLISNKPFIVKIHHLEPNEIKNSGLLYKKVLNSAIGFIVQEHSSTICEVNKQFHSKKIVVGNFCGVDSTKFRVHFKG